MSDPTWRRRAAATIALLLSIAGASGLLGFPWRLGGAGPRPALRAAPTAPASSPDSPHLALGTPEADGIADTLVLRPAYALGYSRDRHGASWAAWRLDRGDLGAVERFAGHFLPDPAVPAAAQVIHSDYDATGFDRGHLCPSADRTANAEAQASTFLLGNVLPQRPALNRGPWEALEKYHRRLAKGGERLFIAAGPVWGDRAATLGHHAPVPVPAAFWKVAVIVCGTCGLEAVDATTPVMAVVLPNDETVGKRWMTYATTIADVEHRSGYHLLGQVPQAVRVRLASKVDAVDR